MNVRDFIRTRLPLAPVPFIPEIRLHKASATSGLMRLAEADPDFGSPYWAHYWNGGLALGRFLLDHPHMVAGRKVIDLGTGSGLVAIAAAKSGAAAVLGADVDPYAIEAARLNAEANGVAVELWLGDATRAGLPEPCELILVGDLFYDRATARRVLRLLRRAQTEGCEALIGDPRRAFLPAEQLETIATYQLDETSGTEEAEGKPSSVFRLKDRPRRRR